METNEVIKAFAALAQDTRLRIYRFLIEAGPAGQPVGEIGAELGTSPATLSFHLKELSHAGLINARQAGRFIYYAADFAQMNAVIAFLTDNCCARDGTCCVPVTRTSKVRARTLKAAR
ncbi:MAG: ArsR family transcriptional regulator [Gammaproteobacteria bacterium]|nr:ArsR family transcriptional regulator [Gammaproteobacteria bacterium]